MIDAWIWIVPPIVCQLKITVIYSITDGTSFSVLLKLFISLILSIFEIRHVLTKCHQVYEIISVYMIIKCKNVYVLLDQ